MNTEQSRLPDETSLIDTDRRLIDAFKNGSMEAMEQIVERYGDSIFTFGLKMCRHREDAEDVTQETLLNAFRYLDGFRGDTKLRNWLFTIAARVCIRKRRKKKCEPDRTLSLESFARDDGSHGTYEIPDWSEDPADTLLRTETKRIIDDAIDELPPKYRAVFTLRDVEGFSTQETADIMDISPQSVKTRLHRARLFLRDGIAHHYGKDSAQ